MIAAAFVFLPSEAEAAPPANVALFKDRDPWGYNSNEVAMDVWGIPWDKFDSTDIGNINLNLYEKVIIASNQEVYFYEALEANRDWFETFVKFGGVFEFHGATYSSWNWAGIIMPGGFTYEMVFIDDVTITNTTHDIVNVPNTINNIELDGWNSASHGIVTDMQLPYDIIMSDTATGDPVCVEMPYYSGSFVATIQTLEWAYAWGYSSVLENFVFYMPPKQPHDISVVDIGVPDVNERTVPVMVDATIKNTGASTEVGIAVNFLINGQQVSSTNIMSLGMGNLTIVSFPWTPMVDGIYNLTVLVPPVSGENVTINNVQSKFVTVIDTTPPDIPIGLSVDLVATGSALNVSWDANTEPDLTAYNVYRSMDAITYILAGQVAAGTEYLVDTALTNGLTYFYRISAEDYVPNESPWSPAVANSPDFDTDDDGLGDMNDFDDDDDGVPDIIDIFPLDPNEWADSDGDGVGDNADSDDDNDGVDDVEDDFPRNPNEWTDTDGDGVGDNADNDDDDDGYTDDLESQLGSDPKDPASVPLDTDGDGVPDVYDDDDDNDGYSDLVEEEAGSDPTDPGSVPLDTDGDGIIDQFDEDDDGDGYSDQMEEEAGSDPKNAMSTPPDNDGDGIIDQYDEDDDNDGFSDAIEEEAGTDPLDAASLPIDTDDDGAINLYDQDDDGDGVYDEDDDFPTNPAESVDSDGDGVGDNLDDDDDGDGVADSQDDFPLNPFEYVDTDNDGIGDNSDVDADGNGIADYLEPVAPDPPEEPYDYSPVLLIVVIILMIVILAVMFMGRRSKSEPSGKSEETSPPPPED
jgi:hypothetical protein